VLWGEALIEALVDMSDDAVLGNDQHGRVATWNRSAERLFGFRAAEVVGTRLTDLFPEHVRRELIVVLEAVGAGERVSHFETEILRKDGLPVPISMSLCPVLDRAHRPVASVVVARDITEQRLAQARLAEIEDQVRESEALAHVGRWLWDVRTGTVQWSDEFHRIHGVDPLDFEGTLDAHLAHVHPDDRERVWQAMDEAVRTDRPFEEEYRVLRPDDDERRVHTRAQPTLDSAGTVVGLRGFGQDVTDRA